MGIFACVHVYVYVYWLQHWWRAQDKFSTLWENQVNFECWCNKPWSMDTFDYLRQGSYVIWMSLFVSLWKGLHKNYGRDFPPNVVKGWVREIHIEFYCSFKPGGRSRDFLSLSLTSLRLSNQTCCSKLIVCLTVIFVNVAKTRIQSELVMVLKWPTWKQKCCHTEVNMDITEIRGHDR